MEDLQSVREAIRAGKDPKEVLAAYETPAKHIKSIPVNNLTVDVLDCGFPSLNDFMVFKRGRGELIVFGARPSMGKSAFLFQVASHVAKDNNVLIYSLEMDVESIKARMIAGETGRGLTNIYKGRVPQNVIQNANDRISQLNFFVDDRSGLDVRTMRANAIAHHARYPLSLIVVDYLQLMKVSRDRQSRNEEVGDLSAELKGLAKDLKCPVLVAAQLNRQVEMRGGQTGNYRPMLSDLRESGSIEQDADQVLFLTRPGVYTGGDKTVAEVGVAKARNGQTGWFTFQFLDASTKFVDTQQQLVIKSKNRNNEENEEW